VNVKSEHILNTSIFPYLNQFVLDHLHDPKYELADSDKYTFEPKYFDKETFVYRDNPKNPDFVAGQDPEKDRYNEMLMIGLRTSWGVDLAKIKNNFSDEIIQKFNADIQPKIEQGILLIENNHLKIPEKHWFFADGIASEFFLVNDFIDFMNIFFYIFRSKSSH